MRTDQGNTRRLLVALLVALLLGGNLSGCLGSRDRPLQLLNGADPQYPAAALAAGIQGFVTVSYAVSIEGRVSNVTVEESQPAGVFDEAAVMAVKRWRYKAPQRQGQAYAPPRVLSTLQFKLADAAAAAKYEGF